MESIQTEKAIMDKLLERKISNYQKKLRKCIGDMDKETRSFEKFANDNELMLLEIDVELSDIEEWVEKYNELRRQMINHLKNTAALTSGGR